MFRLSPMPMAKPMAMKPMTRPAVAFGQTDAEKGAPNGGKETRPIREELKSEPRK